MDEFFFFKTQSELRPDAASPVATTTTKGCPHYEKLREQEREPRRHTQWGRDVGTARLVMPDSHSEDTRRRTSHSDMIQRSRSSSSVLLEPAASGWAGAPLRPSLA